MFEHKSAVPSQASLSPPGTSSIPASNLRICVTSRPETDIKPILEPLTFRCISLHDESGQKEDIENYIESIVKSDRRMRRWTPEHKQRVIKLMF